MRRSKEHITGEILETCKEPTGKTTIVYQCNLNFYTVKLYLKRLIDAGLLDVSGTDQILYKTTNAGMNALEHIDAFRSLLMPAAKSQDELASTEGL